MFFQHASNIAVNLPTITIEFDKDIEATDNACIYIVGENGSIVAGVDVQDVIVSGRFATFTVPNSSVLDYSTTYTVALSAGSFHNSYISNAGYVWSFTTVPAPATAPKVKSTSPANNVQNIAVNPTITIEFDKDLLFLMFWIIAQPIQQNYQWAHSIVIMY